MSDVIISRRGSGKSGNHRFVTEYLCFNHNYVVPEGIVNNEIKVTIIGAGGTGNDNTTWRYGGGSGYFNNGIFRVQPGEIIPVTIGSSIQNIISVSVNGANGGSTSFGTYLSANGGTRYGKGGAGGSTCRYDGGIGYQFGGGYGWWRGGDGGPYGGGGGSGWMNFHAGNGGIYGGGGGGAYSASSNGDAALKTHGGNGGEYGGGGGVGYSTNYECIIGIGGKFGGNGGSGIWWNPTNRKYSRTTNAKNGTNTMSFDNVPNDELMGISLKGVGSAGYVVKGNGGAGGGGYGGNGGNVTNNSMYGAGGGGYGSNGGHSGVDGPGGGGGYGGDGGNNRGGGGGYGKIAKGGSADISHYYGGGGGYYCPAGGIRVVNAEFGYEANYLSGSGGGLGIIENNVLVASYGSGGHFPLVAENGICIIQYYI